MIQHGKRVSLEYSVYLQDGTEIDTNVGEPPLLFTLGQNQVFPALENALLGLAIGDCKKIVLMPDDAYGPVVKEAFREVDIDVVPPQHRKEGAVLGIQDPAGGVFPIRVHQIKDKKAVLDFNHPLAGQTLHFNVKVIRVE